MPAPRKSVAPSAVDHNRPDRRPELFVAYNAEPARSARDAARVRQNRTGTGPRERFQSTPATDPGSAVADQLRDLTEHLAASRSTNIGFPGCLDFDYTPLAALFTQHLLNNIGDPYVAGRVVNHAKAMECEVVETVADLLRAPADDRWGYVTTGATEGTLYALDVARHNLPDAIVYYSQAAHYSVVKSVRLLSMPSIVVAATDTGEISYQDLTAQVLIHRDRPAVVVANVGTVMSEAVDDVARIRQILDRLLVRRRFIHADAALAGLPLALLPPEQARPGFDFADGADAMIVSGHKFWGSPVPCGVVVVRAHLRPARTDLVDYIGTADATITGSRSGHAALVLWYALRHHGRDGLAARAEQARDLAAYTVDQLTGLGWEAYRHRWAFTVVLKTPPAAVTRRWTLAEQDGWSHIVCLPGMSRVQIDAFVDDLRTAMAGGEMKETQ